MPTWKPASVIASTPERVATLIRVRGNVQGVGYRPFVYRVARETGVAGWVRNDPDGVLIRAEGSPRDLARFHEALRAEAPPSAAIDEMTIEPAPADGLHGFTIDSSGSAARPARVRMPHDLATCAACRGEVFDPHDRRAGYPFTNCTACGPRYSIIEGLPYDRPRTSMRRFVHVRGVPGGVSLPRGPAVPRRAHRVRRCGPRAVLRGRDGREQARGAEALAAAIGLDPRREGRGPQGARRVPAPRPRRSVRAGRPPPRAEGTADQAAGGHGGDDRGRRTPGRGRPDGASPAHEPREPDRAARAPACRSGRPWDRARGRAPAVEPRRLPAHDAAASPPARRARLPGGRHQRQPQRRADRHGRMGAYANDSAASPTPSSITTGRSCAGSMTRSCG